MDKTPLEPEASSAPSPPQDDQPVASTSSAESPLTAPVASSEPSSQLATDAVPMGKKAMKRAARMAELEATKADRRLRERTAKKEKKAAKRADAEAGINVEEFNRQRDERLAKKIAEQRFDNMRKQPEGTFFNARIIIDLGFDELMGDPVSPTSRGRQPWNPDVQPAHNTLLTIPYDRKSNRSLRSFLTCTMSIDTRNSRSGRCS